MPFLKSHHARPIFPRTSPTKHNRYEFVLVIHVTPFPSTDSEVVQLYYPPLTAARGFQGANVLFGLVLINNRHLLGIAKHGRMVTTLAQVVIQLDCAIFADPTLVMQHPISCSTEQPWLTRYSDRGYNRVVS